MKNPIIAASLLAVFAFASCSPSREDMKKDLVKGCEEGDASTLFVGSTISADKQKQMAHDYCDCLAENVLNKYSVDELKAMNKMPEADRNAKLQVVAQPCVTDFQNKKLEAEAQNTPATNTTP